MARRHYKKSTGGKKRGPKKGSHQSAAHRKAISEGLKRYWSGKGKRGSRGGSKRRHRRAEFRRKRRAGHKKRMAHILHRKGRKRAHGGGRPKGSKNKYLTHDPRTGRSYY